MMMVYLLIKLEIYIIKDIEKDRERFIYYLV